MAQTLVTYKGEKGEQKGFEESDQVQIGKTIFPRGVAVPVDSDLANTLKADEHGYYAGYKFGFEDVPDAVAAAVAEATPEVISAAESGGGPAEGVNAQNIGRRTTRNTA